MASEPTTTDRDARYAELEAEIKGKVCLRCDVRPSIAWAGGITGESTFMLRCGCFPDAPRLVKAESYVERRHMNMVNKALERRPAEVPLTLDEIKEFISPLATEPEAYIFLRFCKANGLNPFVRDAYLIKYDKSKAAQIIVGVDAFLKRAADHDQYLGYQAGIVISDNTGARVEVEGSLVGEGETLLGGWCVVKRGDWPDPLKVVVGFKEYNLNQALWKTHPATMIEKVAISQGHRRAFPKQMASLETAELAVEVGDIPEPSPTAIEDPGLYPPDPSEAAPTPPTEAASPNGKPGLHHIGDLLNAVKDRWGKPAQEVYSALGVKDAGQIDDYSKAYAELEKLWGQEG